MGRSQRDISTLIAARIGKVTPARSTPKLKLSGLPVNDQIAGAPEVAGARQEDLVGLTRSIERSAGRDEYSRQVTASLVALENMNAVDTAIAEVGFIECLARLTPSQVLCGSLGKSWRGSTVNCPNGGDTLELT